MRANKFIKALALVVFLSVELIAQDILLEQDVNADTIVSDIGPNKKKFQHFYIGLGFSVSPDSAGSRINYGKSFDFTVGYRVKRRVNNWYAWGLDMAYHLNSYSLKQGPGKVLPNDSLHDNERLKLNNVELGFYNRFNFGKRGNQIGNFVDVGIRCDVPFVASLITEDELELAGNNNGRQIKTKTANLRFIEDYNYSGYFRLGFDKFVITTTYRLSPLFIKDPNLYAKYDTGLSSYPELPIINVGVEIGLH